MQPPVSQPQTDEQIKLLTDAQSSVANLMSAFDKVRTEECEGKENGLRPRIQGLLKLHADILAQEPDDLEQSIKNDFLDLATKLHDLDRKTEKDVAQCAAETAKIMKQIKAAEDKLAKEIDAHQTGFTPYPGYHVRESAKKPSPRKRSAATASPSKAGSKRKRNVSVEDDYVPIPYLEVGTPGPAMPRSNTRARTDSGSEDDYVVVENLSTAAPQTRRSMRAASGTPAPSVGGGALAVKKGRGRPRKEADEESPETLEEVEESDEVVINVRASLRKTSKQSPAKKK